MEFASNLDIFSQLLAKFDPEDVYAIVRKESTSADRTHIPQTMKILMILAIGPIPRVSYWVNSN